MPVGHQGRHDPETLAAFWYEVLDVKVIGRSEGKVEIGSWVPTVEDVRHLDVSPIDGSTEDEATRLLGLGAAGPGIAGVRTRTGPLNGC